MHDLNRGRFQELYPFSGGLAAVIDRNSKVGYINTSGELVIPCMYDPYISSDYHYFNSVGQFVDDKPAESLNLFNLTFANGAKSNQEQFPETCTAPGIGTFQARFGKSDTGLTALYTGETDALGNKRFLPYVVSRKAMAQTRYQSTAKLTQVFVAEMTYNEFTVTMTNPTDGYDSGTVALVVTSSMGTVHFIDYELAPHESREYDVTIVGHLGLEDDPFRVVISEGWGAYLNACLIAFESDADRDDYRSAVVYEENRDYHVSQGAAEGNAYVVICNGQPGDDWLKAYTSIGRHSTVEQAPAVNHNICKNSGGNGQ